MGLKLHLAIQPEHITMSLVSWLFLFSEAMSINQAVSFSTNPACHLTVSLAFLYSVIRLLQWIHCGPSADLLSASSPFSQRCYRLKAKHAGMFHFEIGR